MGSKRPMERSDVAAKRAEFMQQAMETLRAIGWQAKPGCKRCYGRGVEGVFTDPVTKKHKAIKCRCCYYVKPAHGVPAEKVKLSYERE